MSAGHDASVEDLLRRWSTCGDSTAGVASLAYDNLLAPQASSQAASVVTEPRVRAEDSLTALFRAHGVVHSLGGSAVSEPRFALPGVGDELFGFRLQAELGRGAFARVFLAGQADLAGRPVVLKVSGIDGNEPQVLAQLQHTHIVPIYSVHEDAAAGLRAVCMPYFGGAALSQVLRACWSEGELPRSGRRLVDALHAVQPPLAGAPAAPAPALDTLARYSYVQATAWLMRGLAEALHHAHQRGVLHRDIKPSNILLAAGGDAMLLDFNLAQSNVDGQVQAHATLGGTIAYMAPEHLRALAARTPVLSRQVNERADVYSLGMVMYEALTGRTPFDASGTYLLLPPQLEALAVERGRDVPSPRRARTDVPWGLESITRKCLLPDPTQRYQSAAQLAEDLDAFLHDRPLRHAPELSRIERLRKWLRRHPRLTSSGSVALLAGILLVGAGAALAGVHAHLAHAQAQQRHHDFERDTQAALCLVNTVSEASAPDHLERGRAACTAALGRFGVLERDDWQSGPAWQQLAPAERCAVAEDIRELLLLLAWVSARLTPERDSAAGHALELLRRAEAIDGLPPARALWEDRAAYLERLGATAEAAEARRRAAEIPPTRYRDHYLLASARVRSAAPAELSRAYADAVVMLTRALELDPRHYWSYFQRGLCYQELGEHVLAAGDFARCTGLWPDFAWGHFNLGYVLDQAGRKEEAVQAYSTALTNDPAFVPAYLNRGLSRLELKDYASAMADFDAAQRLGHDAAFLYAGRGVACEGLGDTSSADAAFAQAFAHADAAGPARQRLRWVYGFAVSRRLPERAAAAFSEVLKTEPEQPQALYGRAMLLVEQHASPSEALTLLERALETQPGFLEARRARAILLARRGRFEAAQQEINLCLERDRRGGATLYAAACVAARIAAGTQAPEAFDLALQLLDQALAAGYGHEQAAFDPDLQSLHPRHDFQALLSRSQR